MALPSRGTVPDPLIERNLQYIRDQFPLRVQALADSLYAAPTATINAGDAASEGTATTILRSDAQMAVSTGAASALSGTSAEGTAPSLARSDHNHAFGDALTCPQANAKVIHGVIDTNSTTPVLGSGFTLTNNAAAGDMTITFTSAFSVIPTVTFTCRAAAGTVRLAQVNTATTPSTSVVRVQVFDNSFAAVDAVVNFTAVGSR